MGVVPAYWLPDCANCVKPLRCPNTHWCLGTIHWRPRRRTIWAIHAADVGDARLSGADLVDIIVRSHEELDEGANRPLILSEDIREPNASRASGLVVPARLGTADVPPPDEGMVALHDAFQGSYSESDTRTHAASECEVRGCDV